MDDRNIKTIQLTLELSEANQILEALGQQPYATVYQLIGKIQQQAAEQLNAANASNLTPTGEERSVNSIEGQPTR